ncbi:MFS transporter [Leptospira meyeri]|uniref:MFS transporter n=1 Tax=Leptospira meyeri TaxID=29508 RepID=UPI0002BFC5D1|nr:MFS transporter [Leptospira meyeri]EMJ89172.1 transporter, major facilitator family protein [Leptospira meyeri serovar Semaranga str. Veldrot Semarang 173]
MRLTLPIIIVAQFLCTSLWFAGNSIISDLAKDLHLEQNFLANLTSSIQFGFIIGTLVFAIFNISDRISPSLVFFICSLLAGLFNLGITIKTIQPIEIFSFRLLTGFFLAGIYPVGMKIASDYFQADLGKSLGLLVGALVFGTAFPHLLKALSIGFPWKYVLYTTSTLSLGGGLIILFFVPDGPYRKIGQKLKFGAFIKSFKNKNFRTASFGYFGHMWELYALWTSIPVILLSYTKQYQNINLNIPLLSFLIIGSGTIACVISGIISHRYGAKKIATISLFLSCLCCLLSPFFLLSDSFLLFILFLFFWGLVVIADSPLFSTLVAQSAPEDSKGSALTIVNCIGFSITIVSIQLISSFSDKINFQYLYLLLAIGPILGLFALLGRNNEGASL